MTKVPHGGSLRGFLTGVLHEGSLREVACACRSYRRQPGVALTALVTLTLGIGACSAIFSVINAVLLKPVSYPDPDRTVMVGTNTGASAPKLAAWRQQTDIFTELSAYRGGVVNITAGEGAVHRLAGASFNTIVLTIFGGVALLLSTIGICGLMTYAVQQRIQEIGIRIALGAGAGRIRRMIVWQGLRVSLLGVAIGLLASYTLTRVLSGFLVGVGVHDRAVFAGVPLLVAIVALVSAWLPARTACRVDPVVALRSE